MRAFYNQRMACNPHLTFIWCNWVLVFSLKLNIKNLTHGPTQISIKSLQLFQYAVELRNRILALWPIKTHPEWTALQESTLMLQYLGLILY